MARPGLPVHHERGAERGDGPRWNRGVARPVVPGVCDGTREFPRGRGRARGRALPAVWRPGPDRPPATEGPARGIVHGAPLRSAGRPEAGVAELDAAVDRAALLAGHLRGYGD